MGQRYCDRHRGVLDKMARIQGATHRAKTVATGNRAWLLLCPRRRVRQTWGDVIQKGLVSGSDMLQGSMGVDRFSKR